MSNKMAGPQAAPDALPFDDPGRDSRTFRRRLATTLAVIALLTLHYTLAARSLLQENPTVDEVVHMPAGITYWQKLTFRLYHHNPPLIKLVAALPVVIWGKPMMAPLYELGSWKSPDPDQSTFSQSFCYFNAARYFELFKMARLMMPLFSLIGGLAVFAWSSRKYGVLGGLLSLTLWTFCPNVLAHARLVTSDLGSTALGVAATYAFWRYLQLPSWRKASAAGVLLGLAQLTKFTMIVLYAVWPFLWLVHLALAVPTTRWRSNVVKAVGHAVLILAASVVTIDCGYFFEGVGIPLGKFEFASKSLTRPVPPGMRRPVSKNLLLTATWQFRVNWFRETWLSAVPCPLPQHYVLGFDEQKIETEGIPQRYFDAVRSPDETVRQQEIAREREVSESAADRKGGYPVYLDGEIRRTGWWYYYFLCLAYKIPEGTWFLIVLALASLRLVRRSAAEWADEIALLTVPLVILLSMSFFTDINLGLRYVLAILPYLFISVGKLVPWTLGLPRARRWVMSAVIIGSVGSTAVASLSIDPHYLAYFNWASGGPDRVPPRLIDSNLDWGQDLVALQEWWKSTIPNEPIGLGYFGQINPSLFKLRGDTFNWFLPPVKPGTVAPMAQAPNPLLIGPAKKLVPGYYAVSVSILYGLPWRFYDPASLIEPQGTWGPSWNIPNEDADAFWYFRQFEPVKRIGHSIYVYHLSEEDVAGAAPLFLARDGPAP